MNMFMNVFRPDLLVSCQDPGYLDVSAAPGLGMRLGLTTLDGMDNDLESDA